MWEISKKCDVHRCTYLIHLDIIRMQKFKNGDKFYHKKFMWAADEKLIINKLGANWVHTSTLHSVVPKKCWGFVSIRDIPKMVNMSQ